MISNKNLKDLNSLKLEYSCKNYFELNKHQDLFELSKEIILNSGVTLFIKLEVL